MVDPLSLAVLAAVAAAALFFARNRDERSAARNRGIGCVLAAAVLFVGEDLVAVAGMRPPEKVATAFSAGSLLLLGAAIYYFAVLDLPTSDPSE
ncbi:hypothetical protein [Halomarina pelagica]|uniref:hypothetical protein n=1 Tax=Halomarina pelagica TaxID=2961599 RepID=UPI0020C513FA|nr:hypothetical protein [Halomarina sp. BND7]